MGMTDRIIAAMATHVSSPVMIGRRDEMQRLQTALEGTRAGHGSTILIGGEAGVGKTRLITELGQLAAADNGRVLVGGCLVLGDGALPGTPLSPRHFEACTGAPTRSCSSWSSDRAAQSSRGWCPTSIPGRASIFPDRASTSRRHGCSSCCSASWSALLPSRPSC